MSVRGPLEFPGAPGGCGRGHGAPVSGLIATRTPSVGIGLRAAILALTSQSGVPAGQRADIPEVYRRIRRVPPMDLD